MKPALFIAASALALALPAAEISFDASLQSAIVDYRQRVTRAGEELNHARTRIAAEKAPLLAELRAAEDRLVAAQSELTRLETRRADFTETRRKLLQELEANRKVTAYATTLAHDGLKAVADSLSPGEAARDAERLHTLLQKLDDPAANASGAAAFDAVDQLLERTERVLGGYRAEGQAIVSETNQALPGTFAFVGPEVFFRTADGQHAGAVRTREGGKIPASYALPAWKPADAATFFAGAPGAMLADASGGKALRLQEISGSVWEHVRKGGAVAFAIVGVGLLALAMIIGKARDLSQMALEPAESFQRFLDLIGRGDLAGARAAAAALRPSTRELALVSLESAAQPKTILEERLQAVLLAQRLHFERRLPLLAVIATAAPLMGLLGTVVGMVRTFALITVFGTGNAGKLSSGISEVLVATELGLVVAIPTLIAHGYLAHRIQKNLLLLERQALELATAIESGRAIARADLAASAS
ncbi:MAG: MotA/TolQ/ExbB proton channel family protein [Opitutae bacterium]|nr:MotA/TolQ/ExbB proton channel family protein [Opitutae bacterium]